MGNDEKLLKEADELYFNSDYKQAMPLFLNLVDTYPDMCMAYVRIASIHAKEKNFPDAFAILEKGLKEHSKDYGLNYEMGQIHFMTGKAEEAMKYLHRAIMIYPKEDIAIIRIIHVCSHARKWIFLKNVLEYVIAYHQQNADFLYTYGACLMQTFAVDDLESRRKAIQILQRSYSLGNRKRELLFYLAAAHRVLGEKDISEKYFAELKKISDGNRELELLF